jgi:hypothetical protein
MGFLDLDIGQPHQREAGQAIGQMHLDHDGRSGQAHQGAAVDGGQCHVSSSLFFMGTSVEEGCCFG